MKTPFEPLVSPAGEDARRQASAEIASLLRVTTPRPDWMDCPTRGPWVSNSLARHQSQLRANVKKARASFNKDWMGIPTKWLADVYDEAADVFAARLRELRERSGKDAGGGETENL